MWTIYSIKYADDTTFDKSSLSYFRYDLVGKAI